MRLRFAPSPTGIFHVGGARTAFIVPLILGYTMGTALLQIGYQAGGALTVAGLATLMTNAVPMDLRLREDQPAPSLEAEVALKAAPARDGEFFVVPAIIAGGGDS